MALNIRNSEAGRLAAELARFSNAGTFAAARMRCVSYDVDCPRSMPTAHSPLGHAPDTRPPPSWPNRPGSRAAETSAGGRGLHPRRSTSDVCDSRHHELTTRSRRADGTPLEMRHGVDMLENRPGRRAFLRATGSLAGTAAASCTSARAGNRDVPTSRGHQPRGAMPYAGTVRARLASEIASSNWLLGCETLDRDFAGMSEARRWRRAWPASARRATIALGDHRPGTP